MNILVKNVDIDLLQAKRTPVRLGKLRWRHQA
jgi:hypothetical protein